MLSRPVKMQLDNLPLIQYRMVGDLGKTITDDQERFELFDLSRRKLLLTLITSFGAKELH